MYIEKNLDNQVRGDTWVLTFNIQTASGTPEDITGNEYWFTLKASVDDNDEAAALQVGPITPNPIESAAGILTIVVHSEYTELLEAKNYFYDLQEVSLINEISTLLIGRVRVVKDVTLFSSYNGGVIDNYYRETVGDITKDMTGFVDITQSDYSFNTGTRTFSLLAVDDNPYNVFYRGKKHIITGTKQIIITNTPGGRYIKLNPTTWELEEGTIGSPPTILDDLLVAYVYWNGFSAIILGDERHSASRDTNWHQSQHLNIGAVWRNGGDISYTLNDNNVYLGFSNITIADEDLVHSITHSATPSAHYQQILASNAVLPVLYLNGTTYTQTMPSSDPWVAYSLGSRAARNNIVGGVGSLEQLGNGKFMSYWVLATNDSQYPIKLLMGSVEHATEKAALAETFVNYGLPFPEMVPLYKIVLQTQNSFINNAKVQIISVSEIVSRQSTATTLNESGTDSYINSGSFNVSTGALTLSGVGQAGASIPLDGRYAIITIGTTPPSNPSIGALWVDTN